MSMNTSSLSKISTSNLNFRTHDVTNQNLSKVSIIYRKAIDELTTVGCLYDAITDSYVSNISLMKPPSSKTFYKSAHCELIRGDDPRCDDLLKMIGIDGELWISLILNMVHEIEPSSFVNPLFPIDKNTRFLHYYYSKEEKYIFKDRNSATRNISQFPVDVIATHIVTTIKLGIEALIVLQLSSDDQTELDKLLVKINKSLINKNFHLKKAEAQLLNQIKLIKVFSNISDLRKMTKITEICKKIIELASLSFSYRPLECTFYPIKWFYPSYSSRKAKYVPLSSEHIDKIKQYLISLSMKRKHQAISVDPQIEKTLNEHLENEFNQVRQEMKEVEELYSSQIQQIRDLVIKMRSGKAQEQKMAETMVDDSEKSWQEKFDFIKRYFQALTKKAEMIIDYDQQGIKYMNMEQFSITPNDDLYSIFEKNISRDKAALLFCSTDELKDQNSDLWISLHQKWIEELQNNPSITLVFADFSYSSFSLSEIRVLVIEPRHQIEDNFETPNLLISSTSNHMHSSNGHSQNSEQLLSPRKLSEPPMTQVISPRHEQDALISDNARTTNSPESLTLDASLTQQHQSEHSKEYIYSSIVPERSRTRNIFSSSEKSKILSMSTTTTSFPSVSSFLESGQDVEVSTNANTITNSTASSRDPTKESLEIQKQDIEQVPEKEKAPNTSIQSTTEVTLKERSPSPILQRPLTSTKSLLIIEQTFPSSKEPNPLGEYMLLLESGP